ncbi:hypothetical protein FW320_00105 [Azospirillum sp. Vi22]|uniref:toxin-antitoxin system TumE family protein n=1 Tax=Azospirillum baldaniorum TaxID=1064539 RepID=UPI00157B0976|nr:DUF6516 family protein [Azospirillum baldaniorum]NUB04599.1 hypothetical protein [Azospirillum baldaniorum]
MNSPLGWHWIADQERPKKMANGWQIVFRAEIVDASSGRPDGWSYALILQDQNEDRLLGFDNSHAFDNAADGDRFDHEHRFGRVGQRVQYRFVSVQQLVVDFFERVERVCLAQGVAFEFEDR